MQGSKSKPYCDANVFSKLLYTLNFKARRHCAKNHSPTYCTWDVDSQ